MKQTSKTNSSNNNNNNYSEMCVRYASIIDDARRTRAERQIERERKQNMSGKRTAGRG